MTAIAWVAIAVAVAQMVFQVVWALVRRPGQRIDRLEAAVFGETGVNMKLQRYVTTEAFERRMENIDAHLSGVSEEGQRREDRILQAIQTSNDRLAGAVSELRQDVRAQSIRVDDLLSRRNDPR